MGLRALVVASFLLVSAPMVAHAQTGTGDVVVLKDGTILMGTVGEMIPNESITITVEGKPRTIAWKDVERVNIGREKASRAAPQQTQRTMVHVDGLEAGARIETLDTQRGTWSTVCNGSCDHELASDALYRIDGLGIRTSRPFHIGGGSHASLEAKTASTAGFAGGLTLVILGGAAFVNGLSFVIIALADDLAFNSTNGTTRDYFIAGGVLGGVGIVSLVVGFLVLRGNLRTTVDGATTVRVPAWRDFPEAPSSRAVAFSFPAISGSF
jgi:hypothetical protein